MADRNLEIALRIKADLESARKQLDELSKSVKATGDNSQASADKIAAVGERIGEMEKEAADANKTLGQTGKVADSTAGKTNNLGKEVAQLARNLGSGNITGAAGNIRNIGTGAGVAAEGVAGVAGAVGGLVAVLALFAVAAVKGYKEDQELARSIIATGNYAGVTTGQVRVMAETLDTAAGRSDNARKALQLLIASGRVSEDNLQQAGRAALDLSTVTGQSIEKSVQAFVRMQDEPVTAVKALDDSLHFLTLTQYQHIKALQDQGDMEGASAAAQEAASVAVHQRALEVVANTGLMERGWNNLRNNVIATWNAMKDVGATKTAADDLAAINKELDAYRQRVAEIRARRGDTAPITDADLAHAGEVALSSDRIKQLLLQKQAASSGALMESWIASTDASSAKANDSLKRDSDFWDKALAGAKSDAAKQKEIAAVNAAAARDTKLAPNNAALYEQNRQDALALIEKKYATKTRKPADHSAAIARAAAAAVDQQVQSLMRLQGALDPTTKAWATYNLEVAKQDKIAATAKAVPGADVAAIDARRNAIVLAAAAARDADLAGIAKKDQDAWEKLSDSLRTPTEVKIDTAAAQIAELNRLIAAGVDVGGKYKDMLDQIGRNSVVAAPQYQGVDAAVSGPAGELIKNVQAGQALAAWHEQQLAANQAFREQDIANEAAANARKLEIEKQFAEQKSQIDQARNQLALSTAAAGFGALAGAAKAAYGEQSKQYRIAFALQKAAALAQSILAIQTSIAESSKIGFPWNIVTIAGAVAQGISVLATINSTNLGGYATGGEIRGPGTGTSDSVLMWGSNGEFMQREAAVQYYGLDFMHRVNNLELPRFATGGPIGIANAPAAPMFNAPRAPQIAANDGNYAQSNKMRVYVLQNEDQLAQRLAEHPAMEKRIVVVAGENGQAIRAEW